MDLSTLRSTIDEIDNAILTLVALRFEKVKLLKDFKKGKVADSKREKEMRTLWQKHAKEFGLSQALADTLLDVILDESKRIQNG